MAPPGSGGLQHLALLYQNQADYLSTVSAVMDAALARGEAALIAVPGWRIRPLREALGDHARHVVFADMTRLGRNPAAIISAIGSFRRAHPGTQACYVGEPAWPERPASELVEAAKHEALINLAFARAPLTVVCPYDAARLPPGVLETARQTHPQITHGGQPTASSAYLGPQGMPAACRAPLPPPPPSAEVLAYRRDLRPVRALVRRWAAQAGLTDGRAADLVIAASELASNTLVHTAGGGTLRIWQAAGELICEVSDQGQITDPLAGRHRPPPSQPGGHGLWVVNQCCDLVQTRTSRTGGTTTRIHTNIHRHA